MSKKYLDTVGLNKLVANILSKFAAKNHSHSSATTNSAGFMSANDKVKLDSVSAGANRTIVDSTLSNTSVNAIQNKAVKTALDGKASSSHTHSTAQITGLDSALAGKAPSSHNHSADNITSGVLPIGRGGTGASNSVGAASTMLNALDVGAVAPRDDDWYVAKYAEDGNNTPVRRTHYALWSYIKSKCDGLYQPRGSYAASSHTHTISNVTNLQTELDKKQVKIQPVTTAGTGSAYTANVPHIKTLTAGVSFTMVPNVVSTAVSPTLNVNNLGAKPIRQRLSNSTLSTAQGAAANWLAAGKPVDIMYDGSYWVVDFVRPNMASAYGVLPVANGGTGATTAEQARKNLGIADYHTDAHVRIYYADYNRLNSRYNTGKAQLYITIENDQDPLYPLYSRRDTGKDIVVFSNGLVMYSNGNVGSGMIGFSDVVQGCTAKFLCNGSGSSTGKGSLTVDDNGLIYNDYDNVSIKATILAENIIYKNINLSVVAEHYYDVNGSTMLTGYPFRHIFFKLPINDFVKSGSNIKTTLTTVNSTDSGVSIYNSYDSTMKHNAKWSLQNKYIYVTFIDGWTTL